ncbi:recombinase family protein [Pantoea sp. Ap-967]|uniref:recombinase family protein n=1 Tax=Pantoea sp. Ap-967 TaxID=2608362 RepID=UPI00141E274A|nr:recombinase family protein [Pantoea sp. Ap-967]NIE73961.1 recombinase family protein [Pantoea sp. Ap-967]
MRQVTSFSAEANKKAAAYVRMSTEHQQYSTENQLDTIKIYAQTHNLNIVKIYTDSGKSGLSLEGREALQHLLSDVEFNNNDFSTVLVYDVSRWGRFQDPDVSASYEVRCRQAGVRVEYCAEQFVNDGSPVSSIIKSVKRMMAGEYSRELSVKVFAGQSRLIQLGYRQGGTAGYGLRRQLIDQTGKPKATLSHKEYKSLQTDRVVLAPGPAPEQEIILEIYNSFIKKALTEKEIADKLNKRGILTDLNRPWTRGVVHQILVNEKYIGNNVWNHTSAKLKMPRTANPTNEWIRADAAFPAIVDHSLFIAAQAIIQARARLWSNEEMLSSLKELFQQRGCLSGLIIDEQEDLPSSSCYRKRFGSLVDSYRLIGYEPARDYGYIEANRHLRERFPAILSDTLQQIEAVGGRISVDPNTQLILVNEEFTVSVVLCRCQQVATGRRRWQVRFDFSLFPDITVAVRMLPGETEILDYYLFPMIDLVAPNLRLGDSNPRELELYRFESLEILSTLSKRFSLLSAA